MTATSVTGLHKDGAGSVDGNNKGSERMTLGVEKLIGTRIVASGTATLVSGSPSQVTVTFPQQLSGDAADYILVATPVGATAAIASGGVAVSSFTVDDFVLTGPNTVSTVINWAVIQL